LQAKTPVMLAVDSCYPLHSMEMLTIHS